MLNDFATNSIGIGIGRFLFIWIDVAVAFTIIEFFT